MGRERRQSRQPKQEDAIHQQLIRNRQREGKHSISTKQARSYPRNARYVSPPSKPTTPFHTPNLTYFSGDVLEWITWGGGGLGDPLTRPAQIVASEVHRKLVTVAGAARNYGVVVRPSDYTVNEGATNELREKMREDRKGTGYNEDLSYDRGGSMAELLARAQEETGLSAPRPQWSKDPYGPHVALPYVKEWYRKMKERGYEAWAV